jgi:hypothetical protein
MLEVPMEIKIVSLVSLTSTVVKHSKVVGSSNTYF